MKIACIIHSLDGGGAERVMAGLASRLAKRGHEVALLTLDDGRKNRHELDPVVVRRALDVMTTDDHWYARLAGIRHRLAKVRDAIESSDPDVVLSFCDRTNVLVLLATHGMKVPVVSSERSDPRFQTLGLFGELARRVAYRRAARLVALTDSVAKYLQRYSGEPVEVIPSAVDRPIADVPRGDSPDQRTVPDQHTILGIGRLEIEKGFERLVEAFARFQNDDRNSEWRLRILGEGSRRDELEELVDRLGVRNVELPGWIRPVWNELDAATVFVLPSLYEGFPSALLEAMAAGVPSIAVDCESGPRTIIRSGENGLLVAPSIEGIEDGLQQMASDQTERRRMGEAGREVGQRFSWKRMVDSYEELLRRVVTEANR